MFLLQLRQNPCRTEDPGTAVVDIVVFMRRIQRIEKGNKEDGPEEHIARYVRDIAGFRTGMCEDRGEGRGVAWTPAEVESAVFVALGADFDEARRRLVLVAEGPDFQTELCGEVGEGWELWASAQARTGDGEGG